MPLLLLSSLVCLALWAPRLVHTAAPLPWESGRRAGPEPGDGWWGPAWAASQPPAAASSLVDTCVYLPRSKEPAAGVKGIDVYFDNDFSMRLQTNKINSLGRMFNSQLYCGETSLVADG